MNLDLDWNLLLHDYAIPWSIKIGLALLIYLVGRMVARGLVGVARRVMTRSKMDVILINFVASILTALLTLVVLVAALDQLGVDTTSMVAIVGAAGLAIGLALQDSLKNFAAGVMMIMFRPFKTGDYVEAAGISGIVEELAIFWTRLRTPDNKLVIVSNGDIISNPITNYSAKETRRVDLVFGIGYDDDVKKAQELLREIATSHELVLDEPAPVVEVSALADSSINFVCRPWCNTPDYWRVYWDITREVKLRFDAEGISIPYPQMDIHVAKAA